MDSASCNSSEGSMALSVAGPIETPGSSPETTGIISKEQPLAPSKDEDQPDEKDAPQESTEGQPPSIEVRDSMAREAQGKANAEFVELLRETSQFYSEDVFDEDDKVRWLAKSVKALQWVFEKASQEAKSGPESSESDGEEENRVIATSGLETVSWKEWIECQGPFTKPHSAIYLLFEEPPARKDTRGGVVADSRHTNAKISLASESAQDLQRPGTPALPNRIRIRSLPIMRILSGLCDGPLYYNRDEGLVILRPFKILVHLEQKIRNRLEEIDQARYNHGPQARTLSSPTDKHEDTKSAFTANNIFKAETDWTSLTLAEKEEAARDFKHLVSFMDQYLFPLREALHIATDVHFTQLWHLFTPGTLIYVSDKAIPQKVWKILQGTGGRRNAKRSSLRDRQFELGGGMSEDRCNPFVLDCYYIDWNGTNFVRAHKKFTIHEFSDPQPIVSLPVLPFHIAEQQGLVNREELVERAGRFVECTKPSYRYYSGRCLNLAPNGRKLLKYSDLDATITGTAATISEFVESRVMVDFDRALKSVPDWTPEDPDLQLSKTAREELVDDMIDSVLEDDRVWDLRIAERVLGLKDQSQGWEIHGCDLSEEDKLLLPARVFAFVFRTRRWACLDLSRDPNNANEQKLKPVEPRPEAWKDLEISDNHRNIIQSLMETHFSKSRPKRRQFDLVRDKGKGLIILLHGVPGVGKTSTAETVSEYYNKPLLPITCGDLGLSPRDVERNLESCFQMAQAWECVLLLDEADIFLAERRPDNVERNALVSVFLRVLEYYEGVLFLTTNKVGAFDEAFKSRISMALYYAPLTEDQTVAIWRSQMTRIAKNSPEIEFNTTELEHYAREIYRVQSMNDCYKPVWNGRQIRNAFQTAVSLAEFKCSDQQKIQLNRSHFTEVTSVSNQFNMYLWRVKRLRTDEYQNLSKQFRDDSFGPAGMTPAAPGPSHQTPFPSYVSQQMATQPMVAPGTNPSHQGQTAMSSGQSMPQQYHIPPQQYNNGQPQQQIILPPQFAYVQAGQQPGPYQPQPGYAVQAQAPQMAPSQSQNMHSAFPSTTPYPPQPPVAAL